MNEIPSKTFEDRRKPRPLWNNLDDDPETLSRIVLMIVLKNTRRLAELYGMYILCKNGPLALWEAERFIDDNKGSGFPLL